MLSRKNIRLFFRAGDKITEGLPLVAKLTETFKHGMKSGDLRSVFLLPMCVQSPYASIYVVCKMHGYHHIRMFSYHDMHLKNYALDIEQSMCQSNITERLYFSQIQELLMRDLKL